MDAQLIVLLEIQDLVAKVRELRADTELGVLEEKHFGVELTYGVSGEKPVGFFIVALIDGGRGVGPRLKNVS